MSVFNEEENGVAVATEHINECSYVIDSTDVVEATVVDDVALRYHQRDRLADDEWLPQPRDVRPEDIRHAQSLAADGATRQRIE